MFHIPRSPFPTRPFTLVDNVEIVNSMFASGKVYLTYYFFRLLMDQKFKLTGPADLFRMHALEVYLRLDLLV